MKTDKTGKMLISFLASAMLVSAGAGCSGRSNCVDQNQDGYCDNGSGSSSGYHRVGTGGSYDGSTPKSSSGITSGSAAKGGIGSSGSSSS